MESALNVLLSPGGGPREAASMFAAAFGALLASKIVQFTMDDQAKDELLAERDHATIRNFDFIVGKLKRNFSP